MTNPIFLDQFTTITEAPGGVRRLRSLVLSLAVRGALVPQSGDEEPVEHLLKEMQAGRRDMIARGVINKPRYPEGLPVDRPTHDVPSSWRWLRLGDVGAVVGGGTPKSGVPAYWAEGREIPWLTPADMRNQPSEYVQGGARDITAKGLEESSAQLLPAGSVLFSSRAPIGHVGIAAQPLATNQGFKSCVPYVGAMSKYLYIFLRHIGPSVDAAANGTTFREVSGKDVALIPVPVPPLAEQQRIVAAVDHAMKLCEELEECQTQRNLVRTSLRASAFHTLSETASHSQLQEAWGPVGTSWQTLICDAEDVKALREIILNFAVRGKLATQDALEESSHSLLASIQNGGYLSQSAADVQPIASSTEPWEVPDSWQWVRLKQVCDFAAGRTPPTKDASYWADGDGYGWVSIGDMPDRGEVHRTSRQVSSRARDEVFRGEPDPVGTLLMSFKLTIGKVARLAVPAYHNEAIISITTPFEALDEYLFRVLPILAKRGRSKAAIMGSTLNKSSLTNLLIPLPPLAEQERIVTRVDELMRQCEALEARIAEADGVAARLSDSVIASLTP